MTSPIPPEPTAPAPTPPVPALPAPAPPSAPPAAVMPGAAPAAVVGEHGYPERTPLEQMTTEQQLAYWQRFARQHEDRVKAMGDYEALKAKATAHDQLLTQSQTEHEKAVTAAHQAGRTEALQQAATVLVDAHLRAAIGARLLPDQITALLAGINPGQFLGADQVTVNTDTIAAFVAAILPTPAAAPAAATAATPAPTAAPAGPGAALAAPGAGPSVGLPRALPDYGQGGTGETPLSGLAAGRAAAQARFAARRAAAPPTAAQP